MRVYAYSMGNLFENENVNESDERSENRTMESWNHGIME
jgi:hypothetical protein